MNKYFAFMMLLLSFGKLSAQTDYTGIYKYSFPLDRSMSASVPSEEDGGPSGELILAKMEGTTYHFWLNVNRGWPSYNNGFITGEFVLKDGKARYAQQDDYSKEYCVLNFTFKTALIEIVSEGYEHCGFGHAVYADGKFKKANKVLTSEYLFAMLEGMGDIREIKSEKAIIYRDSDLLQPGKQYFIKKDKVYTSELAARSVRVQYMAKGQKYIYGWLRKEDLYPADKN